MPNCNTIAICNQKGGVGKTTTTVNLGVGLAMQGKKVLLVDADPQGDLTTCLGWKDTDNLPVALPDKMVEVMQDKCKEPMKGILHHKEGVDLIPSNSDLFDFEISLVTAMNREAILRNYLNEVKHNYDYIIIDCSPSLGMMTLNALSAADSVIIPVQAHYLPAKCMTQLMRTITKVKKHINPKLNIDGILLTLVDNRTNLAKSTIDALRENFGSYTMSKLEDQPIQPMQTCSNKLSAQLKKSLEILCQGNGLVSTFEAETESRDINVDGNVVMQVFENIVSNAVRYAVNTIDVSCHISADHLVISVSDDGAGFSEEELKTATAPYYTGSPNDSEHHFGLGLYLCKILCEKHNGALKLTNNSTTGACVIASFFCK